MKICRGEKFRNWLDNFLPHIYIICVCARESLRACVSLCVHLTSEHWCGDTRRELALPSHAVMSTDFDVDANTGPESSGSSCVSDGISARLHVLPPLLILCLLSALQWTTCTGENSVNQTFRSCRFAQRVPTMIRLVIVVLFLLASVCSSDARPDFDRHRNDDPLLRRRPPHSAEDPLRSDSLVF